MRPRAGVVAGAGELEVGLQVPAQVAGVGGGQGQDDGEGLGALAAGLDPLGAIDIALTVGDEAGFIGFGHRDLLVDGNRRAFAFYGMRKLKWARASSGRPRRTRPAQDVSTVATSSTEARTPPAPSRAATTA